MIEKDDSLMQGCSIPNDIRLEGPEDPHLQNSRFGGPRSRFNTSGPDALGFDWEDLAASRGTVGGHRGPPPIKQPRVWFP